MTKQKKENLDRQIDQGVSKTIAGLKSRFVLIPSMQIKTWKALLIIMFVGGFFAALIWAAYNNWFFESDARVSSKRLPIIIKSTPKGDLASGTTKTLLSVNTKNKAICRYKKESDTSGKMRKFSRTGRIIHSSILTGLEDGQTYTYQVICKDKKSGKAGKVYVIKFSVKRKDEPGKQCISAGNVSLSASLGPDGYFGECCPNLKAISNEWRYDPFSEYADERGCVSLEGGGIICSDCGNGTCETWENPCSCSEDCSRQCIDNDNDGVCDNDLVCVKEGSSPGNDKQCCPGLTPIYLGMIYDPKYPYADKNGCRFLEGSPNICSNCGNGICANGENHCNCPADCSAQACTDKDDNGVCDFPQIENGCLDMNYSGSCDCGDCYDYNGDGVCDVATNCEP